MNITLEEFRNDMLKEINNNAIIEQSNPVSEFLNFYTDQLITAEEILEFQELDIEIIGKNRKKSRIDGYNFDKLDRSLSLFIADFSGSLELKTYTNSMIDTARNKVLNYLDFVYSNYIIDNCEESSQGYQLATDILEKDKLINKIKIIILTDSILSKKVKDIQFDEINSKKVDLNIWDISRIYNLVSASFEREDLTIDLKDFGSNGISCVKAMESSQECYTSYLAVINGKLLADMYIKYGSRLLEGNVRSFLSVRGKINKGIRNTIRDHPELFFAYNNGIVVTATDIEVKNTSTGLKIKKFTNLQVINGGQTTASIANAVLQDNAEDKVNCINVPMKLTVVNAQRANEMIPNIARYANSQNKVDESDFFSNSPFHVRIEELSRKVYAPPANGIPYETIWFYERAKGQYTQEQMKLTKSEKRNYIKLRPKKQVIKKIDLAKYLMSYNQLPHIVSKGNQYNMRVFADKIEKIWKKDNTIINNYYFKKCIALAIIFKQTEKIVSKASWYENAYRANIVTYSMAVIFNQIEKKYNNYELNFLKIWNIQNIYDELKEQIEITAYEVFKFISKPIGTAMITEYCKKEICWEYAQKENWTLTSNFVNTLINKNENFHEMAQEKKSQKEMDLINIQTNVIQLGDNYFKSALIFGTNLKLLNETEISFLKTACDFKRKIPSEKQCEKIIKIINKLKDEGFK